MRDAIGILVCLLAFVLCPARPVQADEVARPNIVFIMADDLGYGDLGCYGQERIRTPNIDRLASEGTRFTQAYAGSSVCLPSRCALMTGLHSGHSAARDNVPHYETYLAESDVTLAEVLSQAGYRCGGVGKWSLGDAGTVGRATNQGFGMWFGYLNQDHAHRYFPEYLDDNEGRLELAGNATSREHYSHHLMTERALKFLADSRGAPFFLYAAYTLPHFSTAQEDPTQLTIPSDAPYSAEAWEQKAKNYAAMVTLLDQDVGRIVKLIDESGLGENTLVIFTSDNGASPTTPAIFASHGGLRGAKHELYEGGLRIPFVARWPKTVPANRVSDEVIALWDMLPTVAALARAAAPEKSDGLSIVDALRGNRICEPRGYLYWDYGHCRKRYDQAVRLQDWKGIRLGKENPIQLYDLSADVGEAHDVADQHPALVARIAEIMETAATPSPRYPVGRHYTGKPVWNDHQSK